MKSFTLIALILSSTHAFVIQPSVVITRTKNQLSKLDAGKGFGEKPKAPKKKSSPPPPPVEAATTIASDDAPPQTTPTAADPYPSQQEPDLSLGKAALDRLRRERAEKRNEELRQIQQVKDVDTMLQENPEAAVIPEKVAQRMGNRMIPFVGIPLFGSMAAFIGFWYFATYKNVEFEPLVVAVSTIALLVAGLLGITYSVMSASWDPDREGSGIGTDEFQKNLGNISEGLSRSRENARLRDRMDELDDFTPTPITKEKRKVSFNEKMGDEME